MTGQDVCKHSTHVLQDAHQHQRGDSCRSPKRALGRCRAPFLREKHNTTRSPEEMARAVLFATGPWLLRDAFRAVTGEAGRLAGGYAGAHTVDGTRYMVYELGQWCARCFSLCFSGTSGARASLW